MVQLQFFLVTKTTMMKNNNFFKQWLVGFTECNGSFHINRNKKGIWDFLFKISLPLEDLQVLHYIKRNLGVGSIVIENSQPKRATFYICDIQMLKERIIPLFETYSLVTSKFFSYMKLRESIIVMDNDSLTKSQKDSLVFQISERTLKKDFVSPIWLKNSTISQEKFLELLNLHHSTKNIKYIYSIIDLCDLKSIISKPWLIGFLETEGNFYLLNKDILLKSNSLIGIVHGFNILQKMDPLVLCGIRSFFRISTQIRFNITNNFYILDTTNSRANENIIMFFSGKKRAKTNMKSRKSLEFRIWSRSYFKYKGNSEKLKKIQNLMNRLKK